MRVHKKYGILQAGVNGLKIYFKDGQYTLLYKRKFKVLDKKHDQIVRDYLNLRYMPIDQKPLIIQRLEQLASELYL